MSFLFLSAIRIYLKMGVNPALSKHLFLLNVEISDVFYILKDVDDNNNDVYRVI